MIREHDWGPHTLRSICAGLTFALTLGCAPVPPLLAAAPIAHPTPISASPSSSATGRSAALGQPIQGRIRAARATEDHEIAVKAGEHFNVILGTPAGGNPDRYTKVEVFRKNPVTAELENTYAKASLNTRDGKAAATDAIEVLEAGTYVIRVSSSEVGAYTITPIALLTGKAQFGQPVAAVTTARGDTDDYELDASSGQHFNLILTPALADNPDRYSKVEVYRRNPVTGELEDTYTKASMTVRDGGSVATGAVDVTTTCTYVVRMKSSDVGGYTLTAALLEQDSAWLGKEIQATTNARDDTDDYVLRVERGEHFQVTLTARFAGNPDRYSKVEVYRKNPLTGELVNTHSKASMTVRDGGSVATAPIEVVASGIFVLRVRSTDVGPYALLAARTQLPAR